MNIYIVNFLVRIIDNEVIVTVNSFTPYINMQCTVNNYRNLITRLFVLLLPEAYIHICMFIYVSTFTDLNIK